MEEITPKLRETFKKEGHWQQVVEAEMELPSTFPETIRAYWNRNKEIARTARVTLSSQQFAEMFVDQNFAK